MRPSAIRRKCHLIVGINHRSPFETIIVTHFRPSRCVDEGFNRLIRPGSQMERASCMEPHGQSPWYLHDIPAYAHGR
jgi:hypothetical protein